jgi:hypothetical protein
MTDVASRPPARIACVHRATEVGQVGVVSPGVRRRPVLEAPYMCCRTLKGLREPMVAVARVAPFYSVSPTAVAQVVALLDT